MGILLAALLLFGGIAPSALAEDGKLAPPLALETEADETADIPAAEQPADEAALPVLSETEESVTEGGDGEADTPDAVVLDDLMQDDAAPEETADVETEETAGGEYTEEDPLFWKLVSQPMAMAASNAAFKNYTTRSLAGNETLRLGIDVSTYQETIDWNKVAASGIEFVIVRVAYRGTGKAGTLALDSKYVQNLKGAKAAGLKVGAYIFSQALTVAEAREEAKYLVDHVKGYDIDLPLVMDFEYTNGRLSYGVVNKTQITNMCLAFCEEVEKSGYESMVYANYSTLSNDMNASQLGRVWLASYTTKTSYPGAYEYWQCSGSGRVSGIGPAVDLDFWFDPNGAETSTEPTATPAPAATPSPDTDPAATPKPTATPAPTPKPTAAPAATPAPKQNPFTDVKESSWYYDTVLRAYSEGIVNGTSATGFEPNLVATRGQVVTFLYRMMGQPEVTGSAGFTDLTQDYYKGAVNWAALNGVVNGATATTFQPNGAITREQLAAMLYRLAGSPRVDGSLSKFTDAGKVSSYARDAMIWVTANGIVSGYTDGTVRPGNSATRAEVCAMLMRYKDLTD